LDPSDDGLLDVAMAAPQPVATVATDPQVSNRVAVDHGAAYFCRGHSDTGSLIVALRLAKYGAYGSLCPLLFI